MPTLEWVRNPVTGSFRATVGDRSFLIEQAPADKWDVWYGTANRRLRIGANLHTLSEAKFLAEDTLAAVCRRGD